jgi:chemotaxis protein methyltransferase CheR
MPGYNTRLLGLSDPAFALLRDLIAQRTGMFYDEAKRDLLADRLAELVVARGLGSFLESYSLLRYDADADRHWAELSDKLAVPETFFWRQPEQLEALARTLVPRHFAAPAAGPFRIWSAACCSGEEPLSIAIALDDAGWLDRAPIEIVASDASPALVERARRGLYGERSFRNLPEALREKYFRRVDGGWRPDPRLGERIRYTVANLLEPDEAGPLADSDVIFCRNVFIYFSDDGIRRAVRLFAERMRAGGHLFVSAAESLARHTSAFQLEEQGRAFVYVRRDGASSASAGVAAR